MPQLDSTSYAPQLVWLAICFALFYLLMARIAIPAIRSVLERRADRIAGDLEKAAALKKDLEGAIAAYEQAIAEARQKAHGIVAQTQAKLKEETDREQQTVEAQIAAKTSEAEIRISEARNAAMAELSGIASSVAGDIIKRFTGNDVDAGQVRAAVDAAIAERKVSSS